jgi:hypothetical protein
VYVFKTRNNARRKGIDPSSNQHLWKIISTTPLEQLKEKYFDYFKIVDSGLSRSGARHRAPAKTIGNARRLDINLPRSAENHPQDLRFRRHQQHNDPNSARGLDNNFVSDRHYDSTTTTRLHHRRLRRADHAAPDKS